MKTNFEIEDMIRFVSDPSDSNLLNTKTITRINSNDPIESAVFVSQSVFPATYKNNQPETVILVPLENWQLGLASGGLVQAYNSPILFYLKQGISSDTLKEIKRLNSLGNRKGTQVLVVGQVNNELHKALEEYKVQSINTENAAEFASIVDEKSSSVYNNNPTYSNEVVIVSSDENAKLYSLPAINWIAHMHEPILFVSQDKIPKETNKLLQQRDNPNIYILGPESVVSKKVAENLSKYGKVVRIAGEDPETTSIKFA